MRSKEHEEILAALLKKGQARSGRAVLETFSAIKEKSVDWLWPSRIPRGKVTLFAGDPGLGKSLAALDIGARLTQSAEMPDGTTGPPPGDVIVLSAEDDAADTILPRLRVAGADLNRVHLLRAVRQTLADGAQVETGFRLDRDIDALEDAVLQHAQTILIIIDPLSAYLGSTDSHRNAEVRSVLAPLADFAQRHGVGILAIHHLNKGSGTPLYRVSASIGFVAAARVVWLFAKHKDDPKRHFILPGKSNLAPEAAPLGYSIDGPKNTPPRVVWNGAAVVDAEQLLQAEGRAERRERQEAEAWLAGELQDGPLAATELRKRAADACIAWRTVRRAADDVGIRPWKAGKQYGNVWFWRLPGDERLPQPADQDGQSCASGHLPQKARKKPTNDGRWPTPYDVATLATLQGDLDLPQGVDAGGSGGAKQAAPGDSGGVQRQAQDHIPDLPFNRVPSQPDCGCEGARVCRRCWLCPAHCHCQQDRGDDGHR